MKKLKIFSNKNEIGKLIFDKKFEYSYNDNPSTLLSITMPNRPLSYVSDSIPPIFEMNLPEGALKEKIKNHFGKIEPVNDVRLLEIIGPYVLGRIKAGSASDMQETQIKLNELLEPKEGYFESIMEKFAIRSGISGVQPKLLVDIKDARTLKLEHYIVKSWTDEYPELALNEYFCMSACKKAGLSTPNFYLSNDRKMFIMKRFDFEENGDYLGFEDMCVLLGKNTDEKYNASYEDVAKAFKNITGSKKDMHQFFKALIMNHLLRNGDGHLKNYGVVYKKYPEINDIQMAPIYDVVSTAVYLPKDVPALKMSGSKIWWKLKTYEKFGVNTCKLTKKEIIAIVEECEKAVLSTIVDALNYKEKHPECENFINVLIGTWLTSLHTNENHYKAIANEANQPLSSQKYLI
ncbi:MAG: type II toxin-antitoxin system HipA family toxin [Sulfurospirillum sp.]|nr:type II toxin-antitoxin system HipA family toxin [Sulfurospirillum sp.]